MSEETFQSVSANEVHLSNDAIFTSVNGKSIDELVKGRLPLSLLLRPPIRHIFRAATKEVSDGERNGGIREIGGGRGRARGRAGGSPPGSSAMPPTRRRFFHSFLLSNFESFPFFRSNALTRARPPAYPSLCVCTACPASPPPPNDRSKAGSSRAQAPSNTGTG